MIERYFPNTKNALTSTINDFKAIYKTIKVISLIFTFAYLAYVFIAKVGNFWVNVALADVTVLYYVFFVFMVKRQNTPTHKVVKRIYHWAKLLVRAASLGILLYGMAVSPQKTPPLSIILATLTIIVWVLQVIFELICNLLEVHKDYIVASVIADWQSEDVQKMKEEVLKAKDKAVSLIKGATKAANVWDKIRHPFKGRKKNSNAELEAAVSENLLPEGVEEE